MHPRSASKIVLALLFVFGFSVPASAHCIVGNRFFPSTLIVDDPCVADEMSMPTIAEFKNGDDPSAQELDISGEFDKTITKNFGVSISDTWIQRSRRRERAGLRQSRNQLQVPVPHRSGGRARNVGVARG